MALGDLIIIVIISAVWVFKRLKDKANDTGAYAPAQPESRMSDAVALFGLMWLGVIPMEIISSLTLALFTGNLLGLIIGTAFMLWAGLAIFRATLRAPKAPFLDYIRAKMSGTKKDESPTDISIKQGFDFDSDNLDKS